MMLNTCSGIISFARELENCAAKFYKDLSQKHSEDAEVLLSFARENQKNIKEIERTYYGIISDAIEGCYAFNVDIDEYEFTTELEAKASYADAIVQAMEMEEKIIKFYSDAAEQSRSLMADIPRAFTRIAKKRDQRKQQLESLLNK
ncbi:hypothetical protein ACFLXO_01580 [Chloroflexota bacterium]